MEICIPLCVRYILFGPGSQTNASGTHIFEFYIVGHHKLPIIGYIFCTKWRSRESLNLQFSPWNWMSFRVQRKFCFIASQLIQVTQLFFFISNLFVERFNFNCFADICYTLKFSSLNDFQMRSNSIRSSSKAQFHTISLHQMRYFTTKIAVKKL